MSQVHMALAILLAFQFVGSTAFAAGRTVFVSPTGNDKADGSEARPLKTLKKALDTAAAGDEIRLAAGVYVGAVKTAAERVTISGPPEAIVSGPAGRRGIEVLHDGVILRGFTVEQGDIGIWLYGVKGCLLEGLTIRDIAGEGVRIKNQSTGNTVRKCHFKRMGREGFDVAQGKKNGEGVYIGTAPEQRSRNKPPDVPDRSSGNIVEDCTFETQAAEAVDIKEDSEENIVRRCTGTDSRDPDGAIFGSRGDKNRFEACIARGGLGHGFRFGGDTVPAGEFGQDEARLYGKDNVMRDCLAEKNAIYGVAEMVRPQDIDASNRFAGNGRGERKK